MISESRYKLGNFNVCVSCLLDPGAISVTSPWMGGTIEHCMTILLIIGYSMNQLHPNISYFYGTILRSVTATIGIAQSLRESHATSLIMLDNKPEHCD